MTLPLMKSRVNRWVCGTQPALAALMLVVLTACSTLPASEEAAGVDIHTTASSLSVEDLGELEGMMNPYPHGVSADGGVIVGQFYKHPQYRGFHWKNGVIQELGTLGGVGGTANGVSADGRVVFGTSQDANGRFHAARWDASGVQSLGTLGGDYALINAVSADGSVAVGYSSITSGQPRAFRWENGVMQNLGTLGGDYSWAQGVSADGSVVVGSSYDASGKAHAVLWTSSGIQDLGTLGDSHTFARAISADGKVVVGSNGNQRAFRWKDGTMQDLGDLGITVGDSGDVGYGALYVNRDGSVVVGSVRIDSTDSEGNQQSQQRVFQWKNGAMQDIGSLGGSHTDAQAISADGSVVVGVSRTALEEQRAFRWTAAEGVQELALLPGGEFGGVATGVTADGSVVVGSTYSSSGYRAVRWVSQAPPDDGDGIDAAVDGQFVNGSFVDESATFSNYYTDQHLGGTSLGVITDRSDLQISIKDSASAVEGVIISASGGSGTAKVQPCGSSFTMSLKDGDSVIATCGSLKAKVVTGTVEIAIKLVDGNTAVVTMGQQGAEAYIGEQEDGTFLVENLSTTSDALITVTVGNTTTQLSPGETKAASYDFTGFFQPIDMSGAFNVAKAGSVIPIKFSLGGDQGLNIFAADYPKAPSVPCPTSSVLDNIEQVSTTSGLKYDAVTEQYNYAWKTGSWAGTCRRLEVKLVDGKTYTANFKFTN